MHVAFMDMVVESKHPLGPVVSTYRLWVRRIIVRPGIPIRKSYIQLKDCEVETASYSTYDHKLGYMRPTNPIAYTVADGRITVGKELLPSWFGRQGKEPTLFCVPLSWSRRLTLPSGHELGAWYLWNASEAGGDWAVDPQRVLTGAFESDVTHYLQSLIYEASLVATERKHRLNCAGLFDALITRGDRFVWVAPEPNSISIWTDFAFQSWYGHLAGC